MKISVKARLLYAIVLALVAAAYSVILFNVKHAWEDAHWIAYGFTLLAFLLLFLETFIPEGKYKRYPMFGMAVSKVSATYFAVQLFFGGILAMIVPNPPLLAVLIPEIVVLLAYLAATLAVVLAKGIIASQDDRIGDKTRYLQSLLVSLERLDGAVPVEVRPQFAALKEDLRFSDPMSHDALVPLEERIRMKVYALCDAVDDKRLEGLEKEIATLRTLVHERNSRCRMLK